MKREQKNNEILKEYELVKDWVEVVFQYCEPFSNKDYIKAIEGFGM